MKKIRICTGKFFGGEKSMDIVALKSNRNKRFTIQQFEIMNETERDSYKKNIVCDECGGEAYYRSAAKDGKTACFGANHNLGCDTASKSKNLNSEGDEETNEFEMSLDFEIAWNYINKKTEPIGNQDDTIEVSIGKDIKKYVAKPSIEKKSKVGLSTILKCAEYKILKDQKYLVNVPNDGLKQLQDVVVELEDIDDSYIDESLFLWGKIHRFNDTWMNTQYENNISIRINDNIREKFWSIYRDKIIKLLHDKNCLIIIFGKVKKSTKGNYYINLDNMKYFYVRGSKTL